jgi:hypothetical protein
MWFMELTQIKKGVQNGKSDMYDRTPLWVSFFSLVHTGPGAHPAFYTKTTGFFSGGGGGSGLGVALTTHLHLALRSKKK